VESRSVEWGENSAKLEKWNHAPAACFPHSRSGKYAQHRRWRRRATGTVQASREVRLMPTPQASALYNVANRSLSRPLSSADCGNRAILPEAGANRLLSGSVCRKSSASVEELCASYVMLPARKTKASTCSGVALGCTSACCEGKGCRECAYTAHNEHCHSKHARTANAVHRQITAFSLLEVSSLSNPRWCSN